MRSVVAKQAPITLEWKKYFGSKTEAKNKKRHMLCPPEAIISRERFYRRDGTVICQCHGGTGRYLFGVTAGRDGNFHGHGGAGR